MKKIWLSMLLILLVQLSQATIPAPLQAVKVYLQGAELTHQATVQLQAGEQQIVLSGLAAQIDDRSLRISADKAGVTLLGYQFKQNFLRRNDALPQISRLMDSINHYTNLREDHQARTEVLQQELKLILANQQLVGDNGLTALELQKMADFYRLRLSELNLKLLQAKRQEASYVDQIKKFRNQLEQERALLPEYVYDLVVDISANAKMSTTLRFQYQTSSVYWEPFYDLRAESLQKPLLLSAKARITQQTAIDWNNVEIAISSAMPTQFVQKPVLNPWVLDFYQQQIQLKASRVEMAFDSEINAPASPGESFSNIRYNTPAKQINYLNYEYKSPDRVSIRHNEARLIQLEDITLKNSYGHYVAPKQQREVLLLAYVTEWENLNLLPGNSRIYLENTLVGESWLNFQAGDSDSLTLSLGIDKRVAVHYDKKTVFSSEKRLSSNRTKDFAFEIKIKNNHQTPINLVVEDVMPVSANKEIEVINQELGNAQKIDDKGRLRWQLAMPANGQSDIRYSFSVRYPKNKNVPNL